MEPSPQHPCQPLTLQKAERSILMVVGIGSINPKGKRKLPFEPAKTQYLVFRKKAELLFGSTSFMQKKRKEIDFLTKNIILK